MAESRFRNGATTELDVTQARTLLESTRATIPQSANRPAAGGKRLEHAVRATAGRRPGHCWRVPRRFRRRPRKWPSAYRPNCCGGVRISAAPSLMPLHSVPALVLPKRISIRASRSSATIGFETSSRAGCNRAERTFTISSTASSLFYSFGPAVQWPILNYGRMTNDVRVQDATISAIARELPKHRAQRGPGSGRCVDWFLNAQEARQCLSRTLWMPPSVRWSWP